MTPTDIIVVVLVLVIVGTAVFYIRKEKKQGKCIGCSHSKVCAAAKKKSCCGSHSNSRGCH